MIGSARKTILLVDSSKFTAPGSCTLSDISEIDEVITDEGVSQDALSSLYAAERKVTVVRVGAWPGCVAPGYSRDSARRA
ncbi:hypothetical protein [Mesorhizobium sp. M1B.F.Ca.ET.045.04.1.1]|uniref:hypothetical protein n=1 Tax=Mesorhizobium sp. M1B.F.Ca.ET.045.04.1.1 TaxID=2493673 RepID=UPI001FDECCA9|nr:hypothetical protein [Mesorhizobium sp. M1B.F.Ca.ET.045.04.1.1]